MISLVLIGDGESPHLLKWARALAPHVDLWAASSRGFAPDFNFLIPERQRLALNTAPVQGGGNLAVIKQLPKLGAWLAEVNADWLHAHYLTSHGALAWAAKTGWRLRARIAGSAWGSDILVTPNQGFAYRWLTRKVLRACTVCTSDSQHMTARMKELGAREVMTFPFGLETLPALPEPEIKRDHMFFANRGLEPVYAPQRVLQVFAAAAALWPDAELTLANDGSLRAQLQQQVQDAGLQDRVRFVGRLDAATQDRCYARARWYLSLPESDSISVSVLEAMAQGCIPILSNLPANRELVRSDANGWVLKPRGVPGPAELAPVLESLLARGDAIAEANHAWIAAHAMFGPAVAEFLARLRELLGEAGPGDTSPSAMPPADPSASRSA